MNLSAAGSTVDYVNTGAWSKKAHRRGQALLPGQCGGRCGGLELFERAAAEPIGSSRAGAAYLHYTPNETIGGVEFPFVPRVDVPLVADMSSTILSRPIEVERFGLIYAGAQKNIGPSGLVRGDRARGFARPRPRRARR